MGFLGFVNWRAVSTYFTVVMWLLVAVLAVVILSHVAHAAPVTAHAGKIIR